MQYLPISCQKFFVHSIVKCFTPFNWYGPLKRKSRLLTFTAPEVMSEWALFFVKISVGVYSGLFFALISPRTRKGNNHGLRGWQLKSLSRTIFLSKQDHESSWTQYTSVDKRIALWPSCPWNTFWTSKARRIEVLRLGPIRKLHSGLTEFMLCNSCLQNLDFFFFQVILTRRPGPPRNILPHSYSFIYLFNYYI